MFGLSRLFRSAPKGGDFSVEYSFSYVKGNTQMVDRVFFIDDAPRPWRVKIVVVDEVAKAGMCSGHTNNYTRYGRSKRHALRKGKSAAREYVRSARKAAAAEKAEVIRERL